jgi:hypothetical protein
MKIAIFVLGSILIPTFGWVWNTHTQLSNLETEFRYTQNAVRKMEENTTEIKLIQRDIQHMNEKMDKLMTLLVELNNEDE